MRPETLETRVLNRIDRKRGDAFVRADFGDLGGYDQVGRVLRVLVLKGRLVKVGQGLYTRARPSIMSGEPLPGASLRRSPPLSALARALSKRTGMWCVRSASSQASTPPA
jgi:hypothetical protein